MFDDVLAFTKIVATAVGTVAGDLLANVRAFAELDGDDDASEGSNEEPVYGALGVLSRARKPDAKGYAEAVAARRTDGLTPVALRDLRINKVRGNVSEGAVSLAGYGGAFVSIDDAPSGDGSIVTVYVPFDFDSDGVPAKAHSIVLDSTPGNESILIVHALGHAVILNDIGETMIKNRGGDAFVSVADDGIALNGDVKIVTGLVAGDVPTAQPIMLAPALLVWISQVTSAIASLNGQGGSTGSAIVVTPPAAVPLASTKVAASP